MLMRMLLTLLFVLAGAFAKAQGDSGIGYQLAEEAWDGPSKTYTLHFEFWSEGGAADEFRVVAKAESKRLEILSGRSKRFKGPHKKDAVVKHQVRVKNTSGESLPFKLEIRRITGKRVDLRAVSVLIAPQ